jgi:hypothetical protein
VLHLFIEFTKYKIGKNSLKEFKNNNEINLEFKNIELGNYALHINIGNVINKEKIIIK